MKDTRGEPGAVTGTVDAHAPAPHLTGRIRDFHTGVAQFVIGAQGRDINTGGVPDILARPTTVTTHMERHRIPFTVNDQVFTLAFSRLAIALNQLIHQIGNRLNQLQLVILGNANVILRHIRRIISGYLRSQLLHGGAAGRETGYIGNFQCIALFHSEIFNVFANVLIVLRMEILLGQHP